MSDKSDKQKELEHIVRYEYDVFIIFSSYDEGLAKYIFEQLEKLGLRCNAQFTQNAFQTGQNVFDNIVYNVLNAHRTLLLLTENSVNSQWVTLETILALEESQRCNSLRLRLLVTSVAEKYVKSFKRGFLARVDHCSVDFNKNDWAKQLAMDLKKEIHLPNLLPVGSMAHGLVFSHYTGFFSYVLPVLENIIKNSKIYKTKPLHVSKKYYMLIPLTCHIIDNLSGVYEDDIKIAKEDVEEFKLSHAGKTRTFKLTIYKITKGLEEFYFFADMPNVLRSMSRLEEDGIAEVDIAFQITRFYYTMQEMINHAENEHGHDIVQLILFNEKIESMASILWKAVCEKVPEEILNHWVDKSTTQVQKMNDKDSTESDDIDATISCCDDCRDDLAIAANIYDSLIKSGKKVQMNSKGHFQLPKASWHVFVLSKQAEESSPALTAKCMSVLADNFEDCKLNVLIVIRDMEFRQVPRIFKCVNMLKASEPNYCDKLLKTMRGGVLRLEHSLPAGDVVTGLSWAYVINYLHITLLGKSSDETGALDFRGRIQKLLKDKNVRCGCIMKMFIVIPKSCTTETKLADKANNRPTSVGVKHGRGKVTFLNKTEPVVKSTGGQLGRPFYLDMFQHDDPDSSRSICFIAEYCTPANCMREMAKEYPFAGLSVAEMEKQSKDFVKILPDILQRETVKNKLGDMSHLVELVYYDDGKESLLSALESHIQADGSEIVYSS